MPDRMQLHLDLDPAARPSPSKLSEPLATRSNSAERGFGINWNDPEELAQLTNSDASDLFLIRRNLLRKRQLQAFQHDANVLRYETSCLEDRIRIEKFTGPGTPFDPQEYYRKDKTYYCPVHTEEVTVRRRAFKPFDQ